MKRKIAIIAALLSLVFLAGVLGLFILVKPDDVKNEVLARARSRTGYALEAGPASFQLGFSGVGIAVKSGQTRLFRKCFRRMSITGLIEIISTGVSRMPKMLSPRNPIFRM